MIKKILAFTLASGLAFAGSSAWSEEPTAPVLPATPEQRVEKIEQALAILQRQQEVDQEVAVKKNSESAILNAGRDGFLLKSPDGAFVLKFKSLFQLDSRAFLADEKIPATSTFLLRRVRPIVEGTLAKQFEFRIIPDFGGGTAVLQDAYLEYKAWPEVNLRAGRFKVPVGLERLQSSASTTFVETALATNLTPNYDLGFQLAGEVFEGIVAYQAGVFNGSADGASSDVDTQDYKDAAARIIVQPFKPLDWEIFRGLSLGAGWSYGKNLGSTSATGLPGYKTPGQLTFFSYRSDGSNTGTAVATGDLRRIAPQLTYAYGPLAVQAEYVASLQPIKISSSTLDIRNEAWQLTGSYVLTGENAGFNGVNPRYPLDPGKGAWGSLELVGRFSRLLVSAEAFPLVADPAKSAKSARAWAYGVNWYLNKNVKVQADYEQTVFENGATANRSRENESVVFTRVQFTY